MNKNKIALVKADKKNQLINIADQLNDLYAGIENSYMKTAELLYNAREYEFDETERKLFMQWAVEVTPYAEASINNYIRVYEKFGLDHSGVLDSENYIPFKSLVELTKQNIPKSTVNEVLRKYKNKNPANRPTVREVKQTVKAVMPVKNKIIVKPKSFAERAVIKSGYFSNPSMLLDVTSSTASETIRIIARHWKNKYHPDKGGDAAIFNRIVKAEKQLLQERGES